MTKEYRDVTSENSQNHGSANSDTHFKKNETRFDPPSNTLKDLDELPGQTGQVTTQTDEVKKFNWLAYSFTNRLLKEYFVIAAAVWVVVSLVSALTGFIKSITELFTQAVYYKSAPVLIAKTIDWHILVLGGALILSITTIIMVTLRSVMNNSPTSQEEKKQHSTWDDMPISNFIDWLWEKLKSRFK
ncbi:hypothetical protein [Pseudomonas sp. 2hn]|uniref:hypothetical protein n=1 Tax=Pseudomonas sp. 2hn TaxID=2866626 RepID=UPI001C7DD026|nr:hypothetical protein [Pseudomonas sp. 2hn]QZA52641.1 hypothetical protein K2O50_16630 [Pseudomonas sp. 2hn]